MLVSRPRGLPPATQDPQRSADTFGVNTFISQFRDELDRELRELPMRPAVAVSLMALPVVIVGGFAWALSMYASHLLTTRLLLEMGPVEIASFLGFLMAAVWALVAARRARHLTAGTVRFFLLFAVVSFVASMEEISWGQSLLDFDTPATIERLNSQGEFNVHNLPGFDELNSFVLPAFGFVGLWMMRPSRRPLLRALRPPQVLLTYFVTVSIAGLVIFVAEWFLVVFSLGMVMAWLSEAVELVMGLSCLIYAMWKARTLATSQSAR